MNGFIFNRIPHLIFGSGKLLLLPGLINQNWKKLLIITGGKSYLESPQSIMLFEALKGNGFDWSVYHVAHEPSVMDIDNAVDMYRSYSPDVVVAIGGGSVIDSGKAISAMLVSKEKTLHYLEGVGDTPPPGVKVPFIAIPTTAGTGSEATSNAVISRVGENGFKSSLRHVNYIPDMAIIDPELQLSCSPHQTACSGMDAFTQLLESYLSTQASPMSDAFAIDGIRNIAEALVPLVLNNPLELELRSGMAYAAWLSGITLTNAGLGTIHGFAGVIGAFFNIPHGVVCGTLMAETNRITLQRLLEQNDGEYVIKKYSTVGRIFSKEKNRSDRFYASSLIDHLNEMADKLSVPKLSAYGITADDLDKIAGKTSNKNNPVKLTKEEMVEVLKKRL